MVINIIGFIINLDLSAGLTRDMFRDVLGGMLPFYPFYFFARKNLLKASHLVRFALIILPVVIVQFYTNKYTFMAMTNFDSSSVVNNIAYSFAGLIPFIFLIKKSKLLSTGLMIIIIFFIIQGAKRGAIFAGSIGMIMYFYYQMISLEKRNRIMGSLAAIILFSGICVFAWFTLQSNEFLIGRMTDMLQGDTSDRNILYETLFNKWYDCNNIFNLVFGFGFASSVQIAGGYAHNDWLELLSNFGVIGIFSYLLLFYAAVRCCVNKDWSIDKRVIILTITLMWFFISLISMSYTDQSKFTQSILLGFLIGGKSNSLERYY